MFGSFSNSDADAKIYTSDEQQLLDDYRELSKQVQEYIRQTIQASKSHYKKVMPFLKLSKIQDSDR